MLTNSTIQNLKIQKNNIAGVLARLAAVQVPEAERKYIDAARHEVTALKVATDKDLARAIDGTASLSDVDRDYHAATVARDKAAAELDAHISSGHVEDAELLRLRDAHYCAGQRAASLQALGDRLRAGGDGRSSAPVYYRTQAALKTARETTDGVYAMARSTGLKYADEVATRHALAMKSEAEIGYALAFEADVLAECAERNAKLAADHTSNFEKPVDVDALRNVFRRRHSQAVFQVARSGGEAKLRVLLHEARMAQADAAGPAPTQSLTGELTPEQKKDFPEVAALEKKRARKTAEGAA